jgi:hypothetical protein
MARVPLERALKKPGRVLTWHAGGGCRAHRTSARDDYYTVLPPELADFVHRFGSDATETEILGLFLDDMLHELAVEEAEFRVLHADDPLVPVMPAGAVLFEIRGYFQGFLEFYVSQRIAPPTDPFRRGPEPRWLVLASPNVRSAERCAGAFDDLLDRCADIARIHDLILDLETVRDGFRSMLRRKSADQDQESPALRR